MSPVLQRSPAATEAMYLMMRHAFELGYRRYEWKCDALNAKSRRAAERLGFMFEGMFRQATVYKGRSRDTAWYSVIDSEWPAVARGVRTLARPRQLRRRRDCSARAWAISALRCGRIATPTDARTRTDPMARIAIGGFQHETNTFSSIPASFADFEAPDAWPGLTRGGAMLEAVAGINLPAAGFVQEARSLHHELVPLTWCSAQPSGRVTRAAYEHISALLLDDLRRAGSVDGVYLDLHGAMVAEHIDDADGELLRRVRALVGPDVPIVASLDYHANVSALMALAASALVSYRTYPHVDMAECGAQAARVLQDLLGRPRPAVALEQVDFLMPLTSQSTLVEPMRSLMDAGAGGCSSRRCCRSASCPASRRRTSPTAVRPPTPAATATRRRGGRSEHCPRSAGPRARVRARAVLHRAGDRGDDAACGAARPADHPGRHAGQSGCRRQRRHDEPDQGARGEQRARRARRSDL